MLRTKSQNMKSASNIVLKLLGLLLLTGAALKGSQLLTEPMANTDIWTNRAFLIVTVEFEIALGKLKRSWLGMKATVSSIIYIFSCSAIVSMLCPVVLANDAETDSAVSIRELYLSDAMEIEMVVFESQILSSIRLAWLLWGERGPPLKKTSIVSLNYSLECVAK